jgi:hypothetical protein
VQGKLVEVAEVLAAFVVPQQLFNLARTLQLSVLVVDSLMALTLVLIPLHLLEAAEATAPLAAQEAAA